MRTGSAAIAAMAISAFNSAPAQGGQLDPLGAYDLARIKITLEEIRPLFTQTYGPVGTPSKVGPYAVLHLQPEPDAPADQFVFCEGRLVAFRQTLTARAAQRVADRLGPPRPREGTGSEILPVLSGDPQMELEYDLMRPGALVRATWPASLFPLAKDGSCS